MQKKFQTAHDWQLHFAPCSKKPTQRHANTPNAASRQPHSVHSDGVRLMTLRLATSRKFLTSTSSLHIKIQNCTMAFTLMQVIFPWSYLVTKSNYSELRKLVPDQKDIPLAVLSDAFNNTELWWTTLEKRFLKKSVRHLDCMLLCGSLVWLFTDHRNLLFLCCHTVLNISLGRQKVMNVQFWADYPSQFNYQNEHVQGEANVMTNIMTS